MTEQNNSEGWKERAERAEFELDEFNKRYAEAEEIVRLEAEVRELREALGDAEEYIKAIMRGGGVDPTKHKLTMKIKKALRPPETKDKP